MNPSSGGGAAPGAVVPVARLLRDAGARVEVTYSPGPQAMAGLVAEAVAAGDVVVSVGGDGMLSSLAGAVSAAGGVLGVVPAGRGNDFARMLGLPDDVPGQARVLLEGTERQVDLIAFRDGASSRVVAGSVYSGIDARANAIVDRAHWLPRAAQYPYAALRAIATYRPHRFVLDVDGVRSEHDAATVVVANSAYYGKGMRVAPDAVLDDGLLDIVVVGAASRIALMRALPTIYDGRHVDRPEVTVLRGKRVELTAEPAAEVGGDGEPIGRLPGPDADPAVVEVLPAALTVLT